MSTLNLTLTTGDCYYPYDSYESHCETAGYSLFICNLFPDTFTPIWDTVTDQVNKMYFSDSDNFICMRHAALPYVLRVINPDDTLLLAQRSAADNIRSYLYSLLNDPTKRSRVTPSLVLDLLHNPEDV